MEPGRVMIVHSLIVSALLYVVLVYVLKQNQKVSENRSALAFGIVLTYMVLFGHGLPTSINKEL